MYIFSFSLCTCTVFLIICPHCLPEFYHPFMPKIFSFLSMKNHESRQKKHLSLDVNIFKKVGTNIQTWGAFEPGPAVHHTGGDIWWHNSLSLTNVECTRS